MTEKLKVSREVADAIEYLGKVGCDFEEAMESHVSTGWSNFSDERVIALNGLTSKELATALIVGYEVRMTPHEVIANEHRRTVKEAVDGRAGRFELTELGIEKRKSFVEGIEFILDTLNIKIKGVNDNDN